MSSVSKVIFFLLLSQAVFALDESRLWLPKKYQDLMPKFISAALAVEKADRCSKIVNGEFSPEKSDEGYYHFVFTCRDIKRRTYNVSYRYPVKGGDAVIDEQKLVRPEEESVAAETVAESGKELEPGVTEPVVEDDWGDWGDWETINSNKKVVTVPDDELLNEEPNDEVDWGDWGDWDSIVSSGEEDESEANTQDEVEAGADSDDEDWGDWGDWEAVVSGKPQIVDEEGSAIQLTFDHAWTICKEKIVAKTRLMLDVNLHEELKKSTDTGKKGTFYFELPFEAKNPMGNSLRYVAACTVSVYDGVALKLKARAKE